MSTFHLHVASERERDGRKLRLAILDCIRTHEEMWKLSLFGSMLARKINVTKMIMINYD